MPTRAENFDGLADRVHGQGGVLQVDLGHLRDLYRAGRAGHIVRSGIHHRLAARGIRHFPSPLPIDQDHAVLLFDESTRAGQLIAAGFEYADHVQVIDSGGAAHAA